jgi:hypothetical protein
MIPDGASIFFHTDGVGSLSPMDRSTHMGMLWENAPMPVDFGGTEGFSKAEFTVTTFCNLQPDFEILGLNADAFGSYEYAPGYRFWQNLDLPPTTSEDVSQRSAVNASSIREAAGLIPVFALVCLGLCLGKTTGMALALVFYGMLLAPLLVLGSHPGPPVILGLAGGALYLGVRFAPKTDADDLPRRSSQALLSLALTLAYLVVCSYGALSHSFMPPNGIGVSGGKARLFHLAGGIPKGFFTEHAWSTLQPSYPPGSALLTWGGYVFAGTSGEWLTQAMVCVFAALCLTALFGGISRMGVAWVFLAQCSATTLLMASLFYSEPLMALLLVAGWRCVRDQDSYAGWLLIGSCGWVKTEGLLFLPILWCLFRPFREEGGRQAIKQLMVGLMMPMAWVAFSRWHGAMLYDYASIFEPDFSRGLLALKKLIQFSFGEPWRYGFVYPLGLVAILCSSRINWKKNGPLLCSGIFAALMGLAAVYILSLSRAPDFNWHLLSMERLLWAPSLPMLYELAKRSGNGAIHLRRRMRFART